MDPRTQFSAGDRVFNAAGDDVGRVSGVTATALELDPGSGGEPLAGDLAAGEELFTNYGADYWGERLAEVVQCCVCLRKEVYKVKVVRCEVCMAYTHRGCLEAHVDSNALATHRYRAPHKRAGDVLPSCAICRSPWPMELTGREQCKAPSCTLPMHHTCPHTPDTDGPRSRVTHITWSCRQEPIPTTQPHPSASSPALPGPESAPPSTRAP